MHSDPEGTPDERIWDLVEERRQNAEGLLDVAIDVCTTHGGSSRLKPVVDHAV
jgi:hypothetical protein